MIFAKTLQHWYLQNKRDLPWRNSVNPYHIWLSEIILQQTRVVQGLPYYLAFVETFPTVFDLANASEQQVLKLWQGLGYYSRARNLHKTAQTVAAEMNGVFPDNYNDLLKLKGIGDYTAAAIASFAYNEKVPVVDGNVFRVLARYIGIENNIADQKSRKIFKETALELMSSLSANVFNQAIMEFGALQCVPKNPDCTKCVFNKSCFALQQKRVSVLPLKSKKAKPIDRFLNYLIFIDDNQKTIISKREGKGIWENLYEFPLIEIENSIDDKLFQNRFENQCFVSNEIVSVDKFEASSTIHKLTHQNLYIDFWKIEVKNVLKNGISFSELRQYPFPIAIGRFIEKYFLYKN
jgi:A/G-specific adenine glycosylase